MSASNVSLPLIHSYRPRSFRERGLAAPFTTPMLLGARLRQCDGGMEVIVPNPSGGRGVYILPWGDIASLGRPTLHDVVLGRLVGAALAEGGALSPRAVAAAVRQAALQGLAGRPVAEAAAQAAQQARALMLATRTTLLLQLTTQFESAHPVSCALSDDTPEGVERRGLAALGALATELGQPTQALVDAMELLAAQFDCVGFGVSATTAPLSRLAAALAQLHVDLTAWAQAEAGMAGENALSETRDALILSSAADLAARMSDKLLEQARAPLSDPRSALKSFARAPLRIQTACERPAWMLNGWDIVCRIWHAEADGQPRHRAVQDMLRCLPALPDEAESWLGLPAGSAEMVGRVSGTASCWRDPSPHPDRVARLERLRVVTV